MRALSNTVADMACRELSVLGVQVKLTGSVLFGTDGPKSDVDLWISESAARMINWSKFTNAWGLVPMGNYTMESSGHGLAYGNGLFNLIVVPDKYTVVKNQVDERILICPDLFYLFPKEQRKAAYTKLWEMVSRELGVK